MKNRPSAQTLMVRPVRTTTLTFDGKSEKFELFEDLFHTMIKIQPDMTEAMKFNYFHSLLRKNAYKLSVSSIRQTGRLWRHPSRISNQIPQTRVPGDSQTQMPQTGV